MENSAAQPMAPRDKNATLTLVLIGVVIILCLGFIVIVIGYIGLTTGTNKTNTTSDNSTTNSIVASEPRFVITNPVDSQMLNGKVSVSGTATYHFTNLKIELMDEDSTLLAIGTVSLSSVSDSINNWQTELDVITSPKTSNGRIVVSSVTPAIEESLNITFESYADSENLVLFTPLKDQVMFSNNLTVRGQAKGLFEGVLQLRLKDENNTIIYYDTITIPDQLINFKEFSYELTIDNLSAAEGSTGKWEFFYESAKDGSEVVLQTIPVRFL